MNEKEKVILDTDFMNYMIRTKEDKSYYFKKIIEDLNVEPVVHEFVYDKEMMGNSLVRECVKSGQIKVIKYEDFLEDINDAYYSYLFSDLYKFCNGRELDYGRSVLVKHFCNITT